MAQPGVGADHQAGAGALDVAELRLQDLHAEIVVGDVVDSGTATALVGLNHLHQLESGDGLEQLAWLVPNTLTMHQVTGILIGHLDVELAQAFRAKPNVHEKLRDIADLVRERLRAIAPLNIAVK